MEGYEKIKLTHPDLSHRNRVGEIVSGVVIGEYDVWSKRHDQRGREEVYASAEALDFNTIFEIRETNLFRNMNETWFITDDIGNVYDIQSVSRLRRHMNRYKIILLYAKRRDVN